MRKLSVALCLGLALVASSVQAASASHPTQICLDLDPDQAYPMSNDDIIDSVWAYPGATDADHPPQYEGCVTERTSGDQDWTGTNIDFEITGVADPDESDSPATPDLTCSVGQGGGGCAVQPPSSAGGEQTIRGWIDFDMNNTTVEADTSEGYDEEMDPGDQGEPDATDVALWTWTHGDPPPDMCGPDEVCWGRITIGSEHGSHPRVFWGRIKRESGACGLGKVTLWKKRPGADRKMIVAESSDRTWEAVLEEAVSGRFYAKLSKTTTNTFYSDWPRYPCAGDRSRVIRVG
jgi:hypothetical protein